MAPEVQDFLSERVEVIRDLELLSRHHYSSDITVRLKSGAVLKGSIDVPPGTPGNPMTIEEHRSRFYDCVLFANLPWLDIGKRDSILSSLESIEELVDINDLISLHLP